MAYFPPWAMWLCRLLPTRALMTALIAVQSPPNVWPPDICVSCAPQAPEAKRGSFRIGPRRGNSRLWRRNHPSVVAGCQVMISDAKRILLIVGGGIAAYKSLDLIRRLRERGFDVRCILTAAAQEFITPLSAGALSGERVFADLFDAESEFDVGHVRLARGADLILVAPATADRMAKMAGGHADDLAAAVLLATDRPVLIAPAMNPRMYDHPATRRNLAQLRADGVAVVGPGRGEMAEPGEAGLGRM